MGSKQSLSAYESALKLLSQRDYSRFKLEQKLLSKRFNKHEVNEAIDQLEAMGLFNERIYIEMRLKAWINRGYSISNILFRCKVEHLKVELSQLQDLLSDLGVTECSQVEKLIDKKLRFVHLSSNVSKEEKRAIKQKVYRYILSKGHSSDLTLRVLDKKLSELSSIDNDLA